MSHFINTHEAWELNMSQWDFDFDAVNVNETPRSIDLKESLRIYTIESNKEYNEFKEHCMDEGNDEDYCYKKFNAPVEGGGQGGGAVKWNRPPTLFKPEGYDKWKREQ